MSKCVYGASLGRSEEFGASDGPGGGNVAVAEKLLFVGSPPTSDELARVDADEFAVIPDVLVAVVSMEGCAECCITWDESGTAGGDICAPTSIDGAELDFLGRLTVPDLLNMDGSRALLSEPTWLPSLGCFSW